MPSALKQIVPRSVDFIDKAKVREVYPFYRGNGWYERPAEWLLFMPCGKEVKVLSYAYDPRATFAWVAKASVKGRVQCRCRKCGKIFTNKRKRCPDCRSYAINLVG